MQGQIHHTFRTIYASQFVSFTCQRDEQTPTPAREFQQWTTAQLRKIHIQVHIFAEVRVFYIIKRCNQVVISHLLDIIKRYNFPGAIHLLQLEMDNIGWSTTTSDRNGYNGRIIIISQRYVSNLK